MLENTGSGGNHSYLQIGRSALYGVCFEEIMIKNGHRYETCMYCRKEFNVSINAHWWEPGPYICPRCTRGERELRGMYGKKPEDRERSGKKDQGA